MMERRDEARVMWAGARCGHAGLRTFPFLFYSLDGVQSHMGSQRSSNLQQMSFAQGKELHPYPREAQAMEKHGSGHLLNWIRSIRAGFWSQTKVAKASPTNVFNLMD